MLALLNSVKRIIPNWAKQWAIVIIAPASKRKDAREVARKFLGGEKPKERTIRKMLLCKYRLHVSYKEFFLLDCENRSLRSIGSFLTDTELPSWVDRVNDYQYYELFQDKSKTFQKFSQYYGRELVVIADETDFDSFRAFFMNHERGIVKPQNGYCGKGVEIIERSENPVQQFSDLLHKYAEGGCVIEELIQQDPRLAIFNPSSLNTVRVTSFNTGSRVFLLSSFFRMGRKGKIVDNAHAGGISGVINEKSGEIIVASNLDSGCLFNAHPDSGVQLTHFVIPRWNEAVAMVTELAKSIPQVPYIGWDLALSTKGWLLVEANYYAGISTPQVALKKGLKSDFRKCIKEWQSNKTSCKI